MVMFLSVTSNNVFDVTLTDSIQHHGQSVDTENIPRWDQKRDAWIIYIVFFLLISIEWKYLLCAMHQ
jgi:hypothetical protein